jgi:mercuric ion transport protein
VAVLLFVVGVAASAVWIRRVRTKGKCGDGADCGCGSDPEPETLQANMFRPGP